MCEIKRRLSLFLTFLHIQKHGGEKGVPFRIVVETHMYSNNSPISLNTFIEGASCQVKVFKPKGADRKHKTDRGWYYFGLVTKLWKKLKFKIFHLANWSQSYSTRKNGKTFGARTAKVLAILRLHHVQAVHCGDTLPERHKRTDKWQSKR